MSASKPSPLPALSAALIFVCAIGFLSLRLFASGGNGDPISAERQRIATNEAVVENASAPAASETTGDAPASALPAGLSAALGSQGGAVGASSPEEAVEQLRYSLNEGDALGAIAALDPVESEAWSASILSVLADLYDEEDTLAPPDQFIEYAQLVFESIAAEVTGIDGNDIRYDVTTLDTGGRLARVSLDGLDIHFTPDADPDRALVGLLVGTDPVATRLGDFSEYRYELRDGEDGIEAAAWRERDVLDDGTIRNARLELITIERDGQWFVSPGYSFLEQTRHQLDVEGRPDFGAAFDAVANGHGADDPEAAVRQLAHAFTQLDYIAGAQLMDPVLFPYAYDYLPTATAEVDESGRQENAEEFDAHIDLLELGTEEWRGRTVITIEQIEGRAYGNPAIVDLGLWCVQAVYEEKNEDHCAASWIEEALAQIDDRETDPTILQPERAGFVVSEYGNRWFIDPIATAGWLADQVAEPAKEVFENATSSTDAPESAGAAGQIASAGFAATEAPIARRDQPASQRARDGVAAIAVDVEDFDSVWESRPDDHLALARLTVDNEARLYQQDTRNGGVWPALSPDTWALVWETRRTSPLFPHTWPVVVQTNGTLSVELFEIEAINVPQGGLTATIPSDGRPLYFTWDGPYAARAQGVAQVRFDRGVTVLHDDLESVDSWYRGSLLVTGDPGDSFTIETQDG